MLPQGTLSCRGCGSQLQYFASKLGYQCTNDDCQLSHWDTGKREEINESINISLLPKPPQD
jgi:hypothetical protein